MKYNLFHSSLFGPMKPILSLMVLSVDTTVCIGPMKITHNTRTSVNLPEVSVWCGLSFRGKIRPFFLDATVTFALYFTMLKDCIIPSINSLLLEEGLLFQQDGALPYYHTDVRNLLYVRFPGRWIGRRVSTKITRPNTIIFFFLCGALKNAVYTSKPRTLDLRREIEITCDAVPLATIPNVCQSVARRQQCIAARGGHFEHL
jgi:hypothetical protein